MSLEATHLFDVEGKVIVITGGGTGIGLMMAIALENSGATVYILGRRLEVLQNAAKEHAKHGKLIPLQCDVSSQMDLLSVVDIIKLRDGCINVLVNNAGVAYNIIKPSSPDDDIQAVQERLWTAGTFEEFAKTFDTNTSAVYYTSVAFLGLLDAGNMRAQPAREPTSQIITVSSGAALRRDEKNYSISYAASKAASLHIAKILANTLRPWKIRSNIIVPGVFPSEMTQFIVDEQKPPSADEIPLERYGQQEDIAGLMLFLISKAGSYVNGGVHLTDGGRLGLFANTF